MKYYKKSQLFNQLFMNYSQLFYIYKYKYVNISKIYIKIYKYIN